MTSELNIPGVTVWAGMCVTGIVGPYFFDSSVTCEKYLELLQDLHAELTHPSHFEGKEMILQQDGALLHFALHARSFLDTNFPDWTRRQGKMYWPPWSFYFTPCDFSLWGGHERLSFLGHDRAISNI